jgi:hypothetical protein
MKPSRFIHYSPFTIHYLKVFSLTPSWACANLNENLETALERVADGK